MHDLLGIAKVAVSTHPRSILLLPKCLKTLQRQLFLLNIMKRHLLFFTMDVGVGRSRWECEEEVQEDKKKRIEKIHEDKK